MSDTTTIPFVRQRRDRLTESIHSIVCLYESGELTEGQATKLINSGDRVTFRMTRQTVLEEMKQLLAADMATHGWKWNPHPTQASALAAVERERAQGQPEGGA